MIELETRMACPHCRHHQTVQMPADACHRTYECTQCHAVLTAPVDECCVYCAYGTVPCPPTQAQGRSDSCCSG